MRDLTPILQRADQFFMGKSEVHEAARAIARVLVLARTLVDPRARDLAQAA